MGYFSHAQDLALAQNSAFLGSHITQTAPDTQKRHKLREICLAKPSREVYSSFSHRSAPEFQYLPSYCNIYGTGL